MWNQCNSNIENKSWVSVWSVTDSHWLTQSVRLTQFARLLLSPAAVTSKLLTSETYTTSGFEITANTRLKLRRPRQRCTRPAHRLNFMHVHGWGKLKMTLFWKTLFLKYLVLSWSSASMHFQNPFPELLLQPIASRQNWIKKWSLLLSDTLFFSKDVLT